MMGTTGSTKDRNQHDTVGFPKAIADAIENYKHSRGRGREAVSQISSFVANLANVVVFPGEYSALVHGLLMLEEGQRSDALQLLQVLINCFVDEKQRSRTVFNAVLGYLTEQLVDGHSVNEVQLMKKALEQLFSIQKKSRNFLKAPATMLKGVLSAQELQECLKCQERPDLWAMQLIFLEASGYLSAEVIQEFERASSFVRKHVNQLIHYFTLFDFLCPIPTFCQLMQSPYLLESLTHFFAKQVCCEYEGKAYVLPDQEALWRIIDEVPAIQGIELSRMEHQGALDAFLSSLKGEKNAMEEANETKSIDHDTLVFSSTSFPDSISFAIEAYNEQKGIFRKRAEHLVAYIPNTMGISETVRKLNELSGEDKQDAKMLVRCCLFFPGQLSCKDETFKVVHSVFSYVQQEWEKQHTGRHERMFIALNMLYRYRVVTTGQGEKTLPRVVADWNAVWCGLMASPYPDQLVRRMIFFHRCGYFSDAVWAMYQESDVDARFYLCELVSLSKQFNSTISERQLIEIIKDTERCRHIVDTLRHDVMNLEKVECFDVDAGASQTRMDCCEGALLFKTMCSESLQGVEGTAGFLDVKLE